MTIIVVYHGECQYLGRLFNVSQPTVRRALRGKTDTDLAKKIRHTAIVRGGKVMTEVDPENTITK